MSADLFRKQAMDFAAERLHGHVVVLPKYSHVVFLLMLSISLVLLCLASLLSIHTETASISGKMSIRSGQVLAQLYLPTQLIEAVKSKKTVQVVPVMRRDSPIGPIKAQVLSVGNEARLLQTSDGSQIGPGFLYVPVMLAIEPASLRTAGLPLEDDADLVISSNIVLSKKTWAAWFQEKVFHRAANL